MERQDEYRMRFLPGCRTVEEARSHAYASPF
jgi:hypothetical protein